MSFVDSYYPELSMLLSDEDKTEFNKLIQMYATKTAFVGSKRAKLKKEK